MRLRSSPLRIAAYAALTGFAIAISIEAFAILSRDLDLSFLLRYRFQNVMLVLWPTSIMMMATEHSSPTLAFVALLISATINAGLYAVLGLIAWVVVDTIRSFRENIDG